MYQVYWIHDNGLITASRVLDIKPKLILLQKIVEAGDYTFNWHLMCLR